MTSHLVATPLKVVKSHLVAHKNHPLHQTNKKWSLEELQQFYFLTIRGSNQSWGSNTAEFEKSASVFMSDFSAKKAAIIQEVGFGWLPEHMIETELRKRTQELQPILYTRKQALGGRAVGLNVEALKNYN